MTEPQPPEVTAADPLQRKASAIAFDAAARALESADQLVERRDKAVAAASEARRCAELCLQKEKAGDDDGARELARRALAAADEAGRWASFLLP